VQLFLFLQPTGFEPLVLDTLLLTRLFSHSLGLCLGTSDHFSVNPVLFLQCCACQATELFSFFVRRIVALADMDQVNEVNDGGPIVNAPVPNDANADVQAVVAADAIIPIVPGVNAEDILFPGGAPAGGNGLALIAGLVPPPNHADNAPANWPIIQNVPPLPPGGVGAVMAAVAVDMAAHPGQYRLEGNFWTFRPRYDDPIPAGMGRELVPTHVAESVSCSFQNCHSAFSNLGN
jgi:hypothetical protein